MDWQPIKTAPKDKNVLVCNNGWIMVASWSKYDGCGFQRPKGYWMSNACVDGYVSCDPTHLDAVT
jgi:hypothetical protein